MKARHNLLQHALPRAQLCVVLSGRPLGRGGESLSPWLMDGASSRADGPCSGSHRDLGGGHRG